MKNLLLMIALMLATSAWTQVMIGGSNEMSLDTRVGDALVIESNWHSSRKTPIQLSSVWDGGDSGRLLINGVEEGSVGANEEKIFALTIPASTANEYLCVFVTGDRTYRRTIIATGSRKLPKVTSIAPWGVVIDYVVAGWWGGGSIEVNAIMAGGAVTNVAKSLVGETNCVNGAHRVYWNMAKDGISITNERVVISTKYQAPPPRYCVIDLTGGTNATVFPVTYLAAPPRGGFNTYEYKSTKLVLRCCPAGADPLGRYTLTKDFYAGLFEVTQKQWELVMGIDNYIPEEYGKGDTYPMYGPSYNEIRGASIGSEWPLYSAVDADSFIGVLRKKTGLLELDLPTEAQWEYACRAGTTTTYNTGDDRTDLEESGWFMVNSDQTNHVVGQKKANAWGLYDMHGNVEEWCLDWFNWSPWWSDDPSMGSDPVGATSGTDRCVRGGCHSYFYESCSSSNRSRRDPKNSVSAGQGFRLFRTVP